MIKLICCLFLFFSSLTLLGHPVDEADPKPNRKEAISALPLPASVESTSLAPGVLKSYSFRAKNVEGNLCGNSSAPFIVVRRQHPTTQGDQYFLLATQPKLHLAELQMLKRFEPVKSPEISNDGRQLFFHDDQGDFHLFDLEKRKENTKVLSAEIVKGNNFNSSFFSGNGRFLGGDEINKARDRVGLLIYDNQSGKIVVKNNDLEQPVWISNDGNYFEARSKLTRDWGIYAKDGTLQYPTKGAPKVESVTASQDGKTMVILTQEPQSLQTYQLPELKLKESFGLNSIGRKVDLSPDGRLLYVQVVRPLTTSEVGSAVHIFDVKNGKEILSPETLNDVSIEVCPNGRIIRKRKHPADEGNDWVVADILDERNLIFGNGNFGGDIAALANDVDRPNSTAAWKALAHLKGAGVKGKMIKEAMDSRKPKELPEEVNKLMAAEALKEGLGSEIFRTREKSQKIIQDFIGKTDSVTYHQKIEPILVTLTNDVDPEVSRRAKVLFEMGQDKHGLTKKSILDDRLKYLDEPAQLDSSPFH